MEKNCKKDVRIKTTDPFILSLFSFYQQSESINDPTCSHREQFMRTVAGAKKLIESQPAFVENFQAFRETEQKFTEDDFTTAAFVTKDCLLLRYETSIYFDNFLIVIDHAIAGTIPSYFEFKKPNSTFLSTHQI